MAKRRKGVTPAHLRPYLFKKGHGKVMPKRCGSWKEHEEECWWRALDATATSHDDPESPTAAHQERASIWQREHCSRRP